MTKIRKLLLLLILLLPIVSLAQTENKYLPSIGINTGIFFNMEWNFSGNGTILSSYSAFNYTNKHHEFYLGMIYPMYFEDNVGYIFNQKYIGALLGYRYFILDPTHLVNIFGHYEFQNIYSNIEEVIYGSSQDSYYHYIDLYFHNVLGLGIITYFGDKHNVGVLSEIGYIIPFYLNKYDDKEFNFYGNKYHKKYFNYNLSFFFKIKSFRKNK